MIEALIVDDEPLARQRLRSLLAEEPDVTIVGECSNGRDAVIFLRERMPDLVFLDVQLPEMDGFEVVQALDGRALPVIVFVTAHSQHAARAFHVRAVDYLLKPYDKQRFVDALDRARATLARDDRTELDQRVRAALALQASAVGARPLRRIVVRSGDQVTVVPTRDIHWLEAHGNHVRLHTSTGVKQLRETLRALTLRLDGDQFIRVHRSAVVNVDRIASVQLGFSGGYVVILVDGTRLSNSRGYQHELRRFLNNEPL